jgi:hypothetical protein
MCLVVALSLAGGLGVNMVGWPTGVALTGLAVVVAGYVARKQNAAAHALRAQDRGWERVRFEIDRARRRRSPLVVARLPLATRSPRAARALATRAGQLVRGSDAVWVEDRSMFVLMTDADRDSAKPGIDRVVAGLGGMLSVAPLVASFPADALTLGGLVAELHPRRRVTRKKAAAVVDEHRPSLVVEAVEDQATA